MLVCHLLGGPLQYLAQCSAHFRLSSYVWVAIMRLFGGPHFSTQRFPRVHANEKSEVGADDVL